MAESVRFERYGRVIDTDPARLDLDLLHGYFSVSDQCFGLPLETLRRMIAGSINFGVYEKDGRQIGYGRVVSDRAAFAYIGDVFLVEDARGQGLGTWLIDCMKAHPELQGLRRWMLMCGPRTVDLYRRAGFLDNSGAGYLMHITDKDIYRRALSEPPSKS